MTLGGFAIMLCISALVFRKINQMTAEHGPGLLLAVAGLSLSQPTGSIDGSNPPTPPSGGRPPPHRRREKIDIGILHPEAGRHKPQGNGKGRIRTRARTHRARGRRLPTFALPVREFLASTATSTAACRRASDLGFLADWACRPVCMLSPTRERPPAQQRL